jgi:hypothetical protein
MRAERARGRPAGEGNNIGRGHAKEADVLRGRFADRWREWIEATMNKTHGPESKRVNTS